MVSAFYHLHERESRKIHEEEFISWSFVKSSEEAALLPKEQLLEQSSNLKICIYFYLDDRLIIAQKSIEIPRHYIIIVF